MRIPSLLSLALVPAALVAQTPEPMNFTQRFKAESPAIEQLLKEFQPIEALAKAESLLPKDKPVFDKSTVPAGRTSSFQFSDLVRTYHLAGKAAVSSGNWEKGRDYFVKAQELAKENFEQTTVVLTPAIEGWAGPIATAKVALAEGAARFKELGAKQPLTPEEDQELKNFQIHQQNIVNGEKVMGILNQDIKMTKTELDAFGPMIEGSSKSIKAEDEEMVKEIESAKFKGKKDKYLAAVLNPKNLEARATKQDKLNFLFRLAHHAQGTPLAEKVMTAIDKVRKDVDPFFVEKPAKKAPKAKKAK
jgi:hypothetical protein